MCDKLLPHEIWLHIAGNSYKLLCLLTQTFSSFRRFVSANMKNVLKRFTWIEKRGHTLLWYLGEFPYRKDELPWCIGGTIKWTPYFHRNENIRIKAGKPLMIDNLQHDVMAYENELAFLFNGGYSFRESNYENRLLDVSQYGFKVTINYNCYSKKITIGMHFHECYWFRANWMLGSDPCIERGLKPTYIGMNMSFNINLREKEFLPRIMNFDGRFQYANS